MIQKGFDRGHAQLLSSMKRNSLNRLRPSPSFSQIHTDRNIDLAERKRYSESATYANCIPQMASGVSVTIGEE